MNAINICIWRYVSKTPISLAEFSKVETYQKSLLLYGYSLPKFPSEIVSSVWKCLHLYFLCNTGYYFLNIWVDRSQMVSYLFLLWFYLGHEVKFVYYIAVLVIDVCIVHYPKTQCLKTTNIYYPVVSRGIRALRWWVILCLLCDQGNLKAWLALEDLLLRYLDLSWLLAGDLSAFPRGPLCTLFGCGGCCAPLQTMQETTRTKS